MLKKEFLEFLGSELAEISRVMLLQRTLSEAIYCAKDEYTKKMLNQKINNVKDELFQTQMHKIENIAYILSNCDDEELSEFNYYQLLNSPIN